MGDFVEINCMVNVNKSSVDIMHWMCRDQQNLRFVALWLERMEHIQHVCLSALINKFKWTTSAINHKTFEKRNNGQ